MSFSAELRAATESDRQRLLAAPIITDCLAGRVSRDGYRAFLTEAYHHVKHTVPLLMACGTRLPERLEWLRHGVAEYIDEEYGHEQWILADLASGDDLGGPRRACTYLSSHGSLDTEHVGHFDGLIDRLDDVADRAAVLHAARMFYRLYGDVFRALPRAELTTSTDTRVAA